MPFFVDQSNALGTTAATESRIDFLSILVVLARTKGRVLVLTLGGLCFGVALSFVLKPTYTATAIILPPRQSSSSAALLGQMGGSEAAMGLGGSILGLKNPADMYVGILESRTIADNIINTCNLQKRFKTKTMVDARAALQRETIFESGKDEMIHLAVRDSDPQVASQIANSYLDQLHDLNTRLETSEAAQRRNFYDSRLAEEKQALSVAEEGLRSTQQKTGVIQISGQAASIINSIAQARAQVTVREVQLQSMRTYAAADNADVQQLQQEIAGLRAHLSQLEQSQRTLEPGDVQIPAGQLPEAALQYQRQARELKYHETLFDLLTRQNEAAKLDEVKSAPILQVVDRAIPPDKKSGPPRRLLALGSMLFGFLISLAWGMVELYLRYLRQIPAQAHKLAEIRSAFGLKR